MNPLWKTQGLIEEKKKRVRALFVKMPPFSPLCRLGPHWGKRTKPSIPHLAHEIVILIVLATLGMPAELRAKSM